MLEQQYVKGKSLHRLNRTDTRKNNGDETRFDIVVSSVIIVGEF